MKIILKKSYGKGTKEFYSKKDMLDYILDSNNREYQKLNDDFEEFCKFNKMQRNISRWSIYDLVDYFFPDYERVNNE